ncbi:integrin alpha [Patescibacteria group bacterium]
MLRLILKGGGDMMTTLTAKTATAAIVLLAGCGAEKVSLSGADAILIGEGDGDDAGFALSAAGDVNADGYGDFLVGAPGLDSDGKGSTYLVHGPFTGGAYIDDAAAAKFVGEEENDAAGSAVAAAGDVNADGYGDFLVGACNNDRANNNAGAAYLFHGPASGKLGLDEADAILAGVGGDDCAGYAVVGNFDTDGDGEFEILVSADGNDYGGDDAGAAYLVPGQTTGEASLQEVATATLYGEAEFAYAGMAMAAGNVNGGGNTDLVVGAPFQDQGEVDNGAVYLVSGPVAGEASLEDADAYFSYDCPACGIGWCLDIGDTNADGYGDIVVGIPGTNLGQGVVRIIFGPLENGSMEEAPFATFSGNRWEGLGFAVALLDADADGTDDLLIGAPGSDKGGSKDSNAGAAYLAYGPFSEDASYLVSQKSSSMYISDGDGANAGAAVANAGDTNADGSDDLLIGAPYDSQYGEYNGAAYLVLP